MIGLEFLDMPGIIGENSLNLLKHISYREEAVYHQVVAYVPQCKDQLKFNENAMKALTETLIQESRDYPTMLSTVEFLSDWSQQEVIEKAASVFYNRFKMSAMTSDFVRDYL